MQQATGPLNALLQTFLKGRILPARLYVFGDLEAAGRTIRLELEGTIRAVGDELELDVSTFADHRELGMTWNRLGSMRTPSNLIVRGRLVAEETPRGGG